MSDLPAGWEAPRLRDVCDIASGATPKTTNPAFWGDEVAWLTPDDLSRDRSRYRDRGARGLSKLGYASCSARLVPAGSVVFSSRAPIGLSTIASGPVSTNQGCKTVIPPKGLDPEYLYWYLKWRTPEIQSRASGTTFQEISAAKFGDTLLLLPPFNEQLRVAEALNDHLSRLAVAEGLLASTKRRFQNLQRSLLLSTIADPTGGGAPWPRARLGDLAAIGTGATPLRSQKEYYDGGRIPWVTSGQLHADVVMAAQQFITERALAETSVRIYPAGTLLVAMYGEGKTRGTCSELGISATTNQAIAAIVLHPENEELRPWVKAFLRSNYESMRQLAAGGVQPNLNLGLVRDLLVPVPPREVREDRLDALAASLNYISRLRNTMDNAMRHAAALRRSLLDAAFSGRLVPQDPADEPASALLERMAADQSVRTPTRRRRAARPSDHASATNSLELS